MKKCLKIHDTKLFISIVNSYYPKSVPGYEMLLISAIYLILFVFNKHYLGGKSTWTRKMNPYPDVSILRIP